MIHKYYDWQLIRELPLRDLGELLFFAQSEERVRQLFPLRILEGIAQELTGETGDSVTQTTKSKNKKGEDILAEFLPIVEAVRGGQNG